MKISQKIKSNQIKSNAAKIHNHGLDSNTTKKKKNHIQTKFWKTNLFSREFGGIGKDQVDSEFRRDGRRRSRTRSHERERSFRRINIGDDLLPGGDKGIFGGTSRRQIAGEGSGPCREKRTGQKGGRSSEHGRREKGGRSALARSERDEEEEGESGRVPLELFGSWENGGFAETIVDLSLIDMASSTLLLGFLGFLLGLKWTFPFWIHWALKY